MIWRWVISFSLSAIAATALPPMANTARVSGSVVLRDSRVAAVAHGDYSGVVISLAPVSGKPDPAPRRATMLQKGKTFVPHVLAIGVGSTVEFPNEDPIFHSAFSSYNGQIFDVGLYPPGTSRGVRFTRPGVVRVFCNIHPAMSAVIVVLDTPWFAVTSRDGSFKFDAPAGAYTLHVYHERATEATLRRLTRAVKITGDDPVRIPAIAISEAGYLAIPHKNKYGRDYAPGSGDDSLYPGARP